MDRLGQTLPKTAIGSGLRGCILVFTLIATLVAHPAPAQDTGFFELRGQYRALSAEVEESMTTAFDLVPTASARGLRQEEEELRALAHRIRMMSLQNKIAEYEVAVFDHIAPLLQILLEQENPESAEAREYEALMESYDLLQLSIQSMNLALGLTKFALNTLEDGHFDAAVAAIEVWRALDQEVLK